MVFKHEHIYHGLFWHSLGAGQQILLNDYSIQTIFVSGVWGGRGLRNAECIYTSLWKISKKLVLPFMAFCYQRGNKVSSIHLKIFGWWIIISAKEKHEWKDFCINSVQGKLNGTILFFFNYNPLQTSTVFCIVWLWTALANSGYLW